MRNKNKAIQLVMVAFLTMLVARSVYAESSPGLPAPTSDVESAFPAQKHF